MVILLRTPHLPTSISKLSSSSSSVLWANRKPISSIFLQPKNNTSIATPPNINNSTGRRILHLSSYSSSIARISSCAIPLYPSSNRFTSPCTFYINTSNSTTASSSSSTIQKRFMGRKAGASAFKPKPNTKKQRKKYIQKLQKLQAKANKHSKPGSKAGPRREFMQDTIDYLLEKEGNLIDAKNNNRIASHRQDTLMGSKTNSNSNSLMDVQNFDLTPDELEYHFGHALIDDLMGNSAHLTSSPTPQPTYHGHAFDHHFTIVSNIMNTYHSHSRHQNDHEPLPLPTDRQISLLLRSYRDKLSSSSSSTTTTKFTKATKSIGIEQPLHFLTQELKIPPSQFSELTYNTLMTCAKTPNEGRQIMKMMSSLSKHSISAYTYSILVDIHAKNGDFRGAYDVIQEMKTTWIPAATSSSDSSAAGTLMQPTLAAYTSLLAACYKVLNTGPIPQTIKAEAGVLAWESWKEMRINGIEADVMAYGAIIRIMAARGLPEKAIDLIEEMQPFNVKPTTLIYTSALKAVAKSHANALRFSGGKSKKNKRREQITAHHGRMARKIVIMADVAQVEQDDGFVRALMLCAATAGDSATAKAIYLANEVVRNVGGLGIAGGEENLKLLHGLESKSGNALVIQDSDTNDVDSKKDTRRVSALLYAYSQAMDTKGIGTIWSGRENKGYLCENSLRLIVARRQPKYVDKSIPGMSSSETGLASMDWEDEEVDTMNKRLRRKKFMGFDQEDSNNRIDDLDPEVYRILNYGEESKDDSDPFFNVSDNTKSESEGAEKSSYSDEDDYNNDDEDDTVSEFQYVFDTKSKKWVQNQSEISSESESKESISFKDYSSQQQDIIPMSLKQNASKNTLNKNQTISKNDVDDSYQNAKFIENDMMTRKFQDIEVDTVESEDVDEDDTLDDLSQEEIEEMEKMFGHMSEEELKRMLNMSEDEMSKMLETLDDGNEKEGDDFAEMLKKLDTNDNDEEISKLLKLMDDNNNDEEDDDFSKMLKKLNSSTDEEETSQILDNMSQNDIEKMLKSMSDMIDDENEVDDDDTLTPEVMEEIEKTNNEITISDDIPSPTTTINDELDIILAGFPERRKMKIREICKTSLGKPSMLKLIPVVRENMPEVINPKWLREKNLMDAEYVMQSVEEDDAVDRHILNSMLQVLANSGDMDKAVSFYEEAFAEKNMSPSSHNDRTILQMYLSKKDITQALQFKEKVESQGQRRLDLLSYGLLIEHYGNHGQIGSAIMTLRECIDVHGSPPGEKSVSQLRLKCRQRGIENDVKLEELIGKDPLEWLKEGEGRLKREYSKKGRSQVNVPYNKLVRL